MRWELDGVLVLAARRRDLDTVRPAAFAALSDRERRRVGLLSDDRADDVVLGRHLLRTLARELRRRDPAHHEPHDEAHDDAVAIVSPCRTCGEEHGRPTFPDLPLVGSVTHAGGLVLAAVAPTSVAVGVGIDTEAHGSGGLDLPALRAWTRAEVLAKLAGTGLEGAGLEGAGPPPDVVAGVVLHEVPTPGWVTTLAVRPAAAIAGH